MMYKIWAKYTRKLPITDLYNYTGNWASPLVPEAENLNFQVPTVPDSDEFISTPTYAQKETGDVWQISIK